ncbi:LLM class F420-dependent oxidoreductase [Mycolicibacillus parakoreensis]|uniref:LLM class F420-dependent oxidoreductase n=1 Tax=Mycolicibacillus parakoreensis TaxID=1069221 RepID=A0ABY3TYF2_9MYCO|nr:LLM class F420-dependent oxidoreductase [Mycolicibacillus parakoreensis]MCV7316514.1 LLM class F420-dependent oxidoreductase [Mycolicibacillus parakoreensis]ULN52743.1 LLM class F420-dependent oxidoreductase [Mycolicibacillus parakoreensis]HLR99055.1 LLM class F420-dependent oxidoreductase [Mycolicibacillus parakoreensis]
MRLGLATPVVLQVPGVASPWERDADIADVADIAETADALGFDYLTCAEHVAVPAADAAERGGTYWDPLATLSFLAARTSRIRLATSVLVLGYHHPLAIAKRYGTLDRISAGRLVLGVGVGSLRAEFDLLGAEFTDRGERADDALRALRASLSQSRASYHGAHYRYDDLIVQPCARQQHVPIWVGGHTRRSLRRAVQLADGWMPFGLRATEITRLLGSVALPDGFEVVLSTGRALDPDGDPQEARRVVRRLRHAGATAVTCVLAASSADHYRAQLAAMRALADDLDDAKGHGDDRS